MNASKHKIYLLIPFLAFFSLGKGQVNKNLPPELKRSSIISWHQDGHCDSVTQMMNHYETEEVFINYIAGRCSYEMGYLTDVVYYLEKVTDNSKMYEDAYLLLGHAYYAQKLYGKALFHYKIALRYFPKNAEINNYVGLCFLSQENFIQAKNFFKQATLLKPELGISHYNLAKIYYEFEDYKEAINSLQKAEKQLKNDADIAFLMARSFLHLENLDMAKKYLEKTVKLDPLNKNAIGLLANINKNENNKIEAIDLYTDLLSIDSVNYTGNLEMGKLLYSYNEYVQASGFFTLAIEYNPYDVDAWILLGTCYYKLRDMEEARIAFRKALLLEDNNAFTYYALYLVYKKLNLKKRAKTYKSIAKQMSPEVFNIKL